MGDLVVASVTRVEDYGAYVKLDEFSGIEGLVHISEISTTWVRNIRDHAREGQKLVLKVLRVNPQRNQIDLSLRRVTGREKSEKMLEWKKERKAESILKSAGDKLQKASEVESIRDVLMEKHGSLFTPIEEGLDEGPELLVKSGLSTEWAQAISEVAKSKIRLEKSKVRATVSAYCHRPGGIVILKQSFAAAKKVRKPRGTDVRIYSVGAPKYRVEVEAGSYESAEKALNSIVEELLSTLKKSGGEGRKLA